MNSPVDVPPQELRCMDNATVFCLSLSALIPTVRFLRNVTGARGILDVDGELWTSGQQRLGGARLRRKPFPVLGRARLHDEARGAGIHL